MSKISTFSLLLILSPALFATENTPEIIEVLAPKQQMAMPINRQTSAYFDDRFEHNLNRTIADKLSTMSGVSLNGQGGQFQSYAVRGFSRARIRTEVDGIPIITDRRAGNSISFIAPDLFSDVTVLKGPSSTIYGSQALGGVVSLNTQMSEQSTIKLEGKKNNSFKGLTVKHKQDDLALGIAYQSANNDNAANGDELNTQFERFSGFVRYQQQNDDLTTTISWLPSLGKSIGKSNVKFSNQESSQYPEEVHSLAQVQLSSTHGWTAKLFHHYQNWDSETLRLEQYDALTEYQSHTIGGQWLKQITFDDTESYIGVDWLARKGVSIGSEYQVFQPQSLQTIELLANELIGGEDNLAIYNKTNWQLGNTQLTASFRYDWLKQSSRGANDVTEQKFNAAFSANTALTSTIDFTFEVANGFRYPTLTERFLMAVLQEG